MTGRRTPARFVAFAIGLLLIVPIAFVSWQEMFVLRRSDVMKALTPLVAIPIETIHDRLPISTEILVPSDAWWKRMTAAYGEPRLLITVVNIPLGGAGDRRRVYTLDEVGIRVSATSGATKVPLEATNDAPYGYSGEGPSSGWLFQARQGERVRINIEFGQLSALPPGQIVVVPDWPRGEVPNALDGFAVLDAIRWLLIAGAAVGVALVVFGLRMSRSKDDATLLSDSTK
jgi:hypothetical protein